MVLTVNHPKVNAIASWTQADLDAQIALGNFAPGTLISQIVLSGDWNTNHSVVGTIEVDGVTITGNGVTTPLVAVGSSTFATAVTAPSLALNDATNQIVLDADQPSGFTGTISMAALSAARTWTLPNSNGNFVLANSAQTLQNKTIDNTNTLTIRDNLFTLQDDGDATKLLTFQLSSISTATTRTLTIPDVSGTILTNVSAIADNFTVTSATIPANGIYLQGTNTIGFGTNSLRSATLNADGELRLGNGSVGGKAARLVIDTDQNNSIIVNSSGSCSILLNANNTGRYEFYTTTTGVFGVYNQTNFTTPFAIQGGGTSAQMKTHAQGTIGFSGTNNDASQPIDTGMSRISAGVVAFGNGTQANASGEVRANIAALGNNLTLAVNAAPATPAADNVSLFGRKIANRMLPAYIAPSGLDSALQPYFARNKVSQFSPAGANSTVVTTIAWPATTLTGFTATSRAFAVTNLFTRMRRLGYVTIATAGTVGQFRFPSMGFTIGNGATLGGFTYILRFGISDAAAVSDARMFLGFRTSGTPANVEPSTLGNIIGMGHGAADTNMHIYYGGSAAQTPIDLGANFPANTLSVDMYELALFSAPSSVDVHYQVTRLNTGDVATGTLSGTAGVVLPANTTIIGPWGYRTNNATALAVGLDIVSAYVETDF